MLGIYIYILLAVPVLIGLSVSLRERHLDRRHFISFVGFTAALAAVAAAATHDGMYMRQGVQSSYSTSFAWKVLLATSGLSALLALRVFDLVEAVLRDPFQGIGKPEPLKYLLAGCWSRRITQEHRLVYRVAGTRIDFLHAKYHY
jgi:Txe/YoeB family toxin of toxin-antitoxin system